MEAKRASKHLYLGHVVVAFYFTLWTHLCIDLLIYGLQCVTCIEETFFNKRSKSISVFKGGFDLIEISIKLSKNNWLYFSPHTLHWEPNANKKKSILISQDHSGNEIKFWRAVDLSVCFPSSLLDKISNKLQTFINCLCPFKQILWQILSITVWQLISHNQSVSQSTENVCLMLFLCLFHFKTNIFFKSTPDDNVLLF